MSKIVILGAGLAGLSCAYHLSTKDYQIYEKDSRVGGLAKSINKEGFIFDFDGHLLHMRNPYTKKLVFNLLNKGLICHKRCAYVYFNDKYLKYPFQANIHDLPDKIATKCVKDFIKAKKKNKSSNNFYEWIINNFGYSIANYFFIPYNNKFWTVPLESLTTEWIDGYIPLPSLKEIKNRKVDFGYNVNFWYPKDGGIECLVQAFKDKIKKKVNISKQVIKIDLLKKNIYFNDNTRINYKNIVSTIPLLEIANIIKPIPENIKRYFRNLKYTSIYVLNIGLNKKVKNYFHWTYFPAENYPFYRIGCYDNFSSKMTPKDCSSLYIEIAYSDNLVIDKRKAEKEVIRKLKDLDIIDSEKDIKLIYPIDIKYGYIIYDNNYRSAIFAIKKFLKENKIYSIGRYGGWGYKSMEDVILEGRKTALMFNNKCETENSRFINNENFCNNTNL